MYILNPDSTGPPSSLAGLFFGTSLGMLKTFSSFSSSASSMLRNAGRFVVVGCLCACMHSKENSNNYDCTEQTFNFNLPAVDHNFVDGFWAAGRGRQSVPRVNLCDNL